MSLIEGFADTSKYEKKNHIFGSIMIAAHNFNYYVFFPIDSFCQFV